MGSFYDVPPPPHTPTHRHIFLSNSDLAWMLVLIYLSYFNCSGSLLKLQGSVCKLNMFLLTKHRYSLQLTYFSIPITCISVVHSPHNDFLKCQTSYRNCNVLWRNIVSGGLLSAKKIQVSYKIISSSFYTSSRLGTSQFTAYWLLPSGLVFFLQWKWL